MNIQPNLTTSIGWIDFSPAHRERMGSVLDLLRPDGMVDELGLGTVRNALANELFPGISTIQTRGRYFFLIPYILHDYARLSHAEQRKKQAVHYLEEQEYETMWQLADHYNHVEGTGVIGISKYKPEKIIRRPSAIYWNGLGTFGFIETGGLAASLFLSKTTQSNGDWGLSAGMTGDDSPGDDVGATYASPFRVRVPYLPHWKEELNLDLRPEEAQFFRDAIISTAPQRVIAALLSDGALWNAFEAAGNFMDFARTAITDVLSTPIGALLTLAHDFSELMYGAHLYYNVLLQRPYKSGHYGAEWEDWKRYLPQAMIDYTGFRPEALWAFTPAPRSKIFITEWWGEALGGFKNNAKLEGMIERQEALAKGSKARLRWNKRDEVTEGGWLGLTRFEYRYPQAKTILRDIKAGL